MQSDRTDELSRLLRERILILDGAMGTMIQQCRLSERDFRGRFHDHPHDLAGDNDLLSLTQPATVQSIHATLSSRMGAPPGDGRQPTSAKRSTLVAANVLQVSS